MNKTKNKHQKSLTNVGAKNESPAMQQSFAIAQRHHGEGRLSEAEKGYQTILQEDPNHAEALHFLGVIALQVGKLDDAVDFINKAVDSKPNYAEAHSNLGNALQQRGDFDQAIVCYKKAISLKPNYAIAHMNLGITLYEQGKTNEAIACYKKAISIDPEYVDAYCNLGIILNEQGNLDEAELCYQKVILIAPDNADIHNDLGVILYEQNKFDEAVECYQKAISIQPLDAEVHNNLGVTLQKQSRLDEAVASYQKSISIRPDSPGAYSNLGNVLMEQGKLGQAVTHYRKAISIQPEFSKAHMNLGNALQEQGELAEAVASYQKALSIQPDYVEALYNYGNVLVKQNESNLAAETYQKALEIKPNYGDVQLAYQALMTKQVSDWHFPMMNDTARNDSYEEALKAVVKSDSVVLDIGTGSGLLALMAARIGAERVETVEMVPAIANVAKEIVKRNGYGDVITVHNKSSTSLKIGEDFPIKANILVTETFDVGVLGENVVNSIKHARANLLTEDAIIIPRRAEVIGTLFESEDVYKMGKVDYVSGFDLSPFNVFKKPYRQLSLKNYNYRFLSAEFSIFDFDFAGNNINPDSKKITTLPTQAGTCHGVAFWFRLLLDESQSYDTAVDKNPGNHWEQAVYLLDSPLHVNTSSNVHFTANHNNKAISFSFKSEGADAH